MRIIISGGRNNFLNTNAYTWLDNLHKEHQFEEVLNGVADGIDECARWWAKKNCIPVKDFPAEWDMINVVGAIVKTNKRGIKYNALAGIKRNEDMALDLVLDHPPGIVVCFPGGKGTNHMFEYAQSLGLQMYDLRDRKDFLL